MVGREFRMGYFSKKRLYEYERELRALNIVYDNDLYNKELFNDSFLKKYRLIYLKIKEIQQRKC